MRELVDVHYPKAERIRVVLDNLSTHSAGALYEAFPAAEARRMLRRLEFHYTPKHASWLNMVEIEIGVLRGQCLDRRIDEPRRSSPRSPPGRRSATPPAPASNGCSQPKTPAPKWAAPIRTMMENQPARVKITVRGTSWISRSLCSAGIVRCIKPLAQSPATRRILRGSMTQRNQGSFFQICASRRCRSSQVQSATIKLTRYPEPISWAGHQPSENNRARSALHNLRLSSADPSAERFAPYHCLRRKTLDMMRLRFAAPAVLGLVAWQGALPISLSHPRQAPNLHPCTAALKKSPIDRGTTGATDTLTVVDQLRPSDEDIVKAFRRATEDRQPVEVQDAALDTDEPATAGPVPLKKAPAAARP